jgi:hypothetical protein
MAPVGVENLGFQDAVEDLSGEQLVSGPAVEAFDVGVLPRGSGVDEARLGATLPTPVLDRRSDELRAVVAADVLWYAYFGAIRSVVSVESDHPFRWNPIGHFGAIRSAQG